MDIWYMSFVKEHFLGALIIRADSMPHAIAIAWLKGINPGGEVMGYVVPPEYHHRIEPDMFDRLLSKQEIEDFDQRWEKLH